MNQDDGRSLELTVKNESWSLFSSDQETFYVGDIINSVDARRGRGFGGGGVGGGFGGYGGGYADYTSWIYELAPTLPQAPTKEMLRHRCSPRPIRNGMTVLTAY